MAVVFTDLSTSLDGYIAGPDDSPEQPLGVGGTRLFTWFSDGDTPSRHFPSFRMSPVSARFFDGLAHRVGAIVTGRRTYDVANAWNGSGPLPGRPLFVMTHRVPQDVPHGDPPYTFVTDGIRSAIEQAKVVAADRDVSLMGAKPVQQALSEGLLDEVHVHLIPVLLGGGVRLLDNVRSGGVELECIGVVDAPGVTHLSYRVSR